MAITLSEEVRALAQWPKLLPTRRGGKRIHISCLYRWALYGLRGVRLETIQVGGTTCTSRQALERFFAALAKARSDGPPATGPTIPAARGRDIAEASRQAAEALR
jgi:hypothetical protein